MNLHLLYALMLAQLAGAALLAVALLGAVALGWPDAPVSALGAIGLFLSGVAAFFSDRNFPEL